MPESSDSQLAVPVIAGNWKMHHGPADTAGFFRRFLEVLPAGHGGTVLVFPPAISVTTAAECLNGRRDIALGIQNIHWEPAGAFTGEISASMAVEAGVTFALVGHSERRHVFGESDDDARRKVAAVLEAGMRPVLCLGETLQEREQGSLEDVIIRQLDTAVMGLDAGLAALMLIAYEPVWAIGTGKNATPDDASHAHGILRGRLSQEFGEETAGSIPILYGGSVKPGNAAELLSASDVDGLLVGGASLDPDSFKEIAMAEAAP